jgi:hypothetical protein
MADLLSAASLLLTALTIIYGLWYPKMMEMLDIVPPTHKADRIKPHREVCRSIRTRAIPLLVISGLLTLIFIPDALRLAFLSVQNVKIKGLASAYDYNAIATSFVMVTCLLGFLTVHLLVITTQLLRLSARLGPN